MSTLRDQLLERRAAEPATRHPLYTTGAHVTTLSVETAGGSMWILPWHHFVFGQHQDEGDRERLVLTFVAHEVVLRGANLSALMTEIVNQRLDLFAPGRGNICRQWTKNPSSMISRCGRWRSPRWPDNSRQKIPEICRLVVTIAKSCDLVGNSRTRNELGNQSAHRIRRFAATGAFGGEFREGRAQYPGNLRQEPARLRFGSPVARDGDLVGHPSRIRANRAEHQARNGAAKQGGKFR